MAAEIGRLPSSTFPLDIRRFEVFLGFPSIRVAVVANMLFLEGTAASDVRVPCTCGLSLLCQGVADAMCRSAVEQIALLP